jgi:triphosphoribosyl-dephospho-CoA synthase
MGLSIGQLASVACLWEATARKPGNAHRTANLPRLEYTDFLLSATALYEPLNRAASQSVGQTVLEAIQATRQLVSTNTNLGMVLLLAPLATVKDQADSVANVVSQLTVADSQAVYEAIRLAEPGGLGTAPEQDLTGPPTLPLREIMALAADRDLIARQYANGFREVLQGVLLLIQGMEFGGLEEAIVFTHLQFLANYPDSLIQRKAGRAQAEEASRRAQQVLDAGWPESDRAQLLCGALDVWLRQDGQRRNPGTTADLVAASLFVALRNEAIALPLTIPWSAGFLG